MPSNLSYPGVYVEEIPSGVRTITGVSTSDTAFIDFFARGPLDEPVRLTSYGDFVRVFGGLDTRSAASYALQQYYLNGGQIAYVVRVATSAAKPSEANLTKGGVNLYKVVAKTPGKWGDNLRVAVTASRDTGADANFDLEIEELGKDGKPARSEKFLGLRRDANHPRNAVKLLEAQSELINLELLGGAPAGVPDLTDATALVPDNLANAPLAGGVDGNFSRTLQRAGVDALVVRARNTITDGDKIEVTISDGATPGTTFDLKVVHTETDETEYFYELTVANVIANVQADSKLVTVVAPGGNPLAVPAAVADQALTGTAPVSATRVLQSGATNLLRLTAKALGAAGNNLRVTVAPGVPGTFNLQVQRDTSGVLTQLETLSNLSMSASHARYASAFINANSAHLSAQSLAPASKVALAGGNDGTEPGNSTWKASAGATALNGDEATRKGLFALEKIAPFVFNVLCLPAAVELDEAQTTSVYSQAISYCQRKRAFLLVDPRPEQETLSAFTNQLGGVDALRTDYAALYFPHLRLPDPLDQGRVRSFAPSGTVAGIYARTDARRGIWKAPAGVEATMLNAAVSLKLNDLEQGGLNQIGINVLRNFPIYGNVVWGARTLDGADQKGSEYKYVPVRRLALYIEESLFQGLKWVVFEPNDEPLWGQIRLNVGAFMNNLFRQGAFQGRTAREAYFVKCDKETTTQNDIDRGIVNILVGFAPLKPAEFVVLKLQQIAGQIAV
jgi:hypothetical protein